MDGIRAHPGPASQPVGGASGRAGRRSVPRRRLGRRTRPRKRHALPVVVGSAAIAIRRPSVAGTDRTVPAVDLRARPADAARTALVEADVLRHAREVVAVALHRAAWVRAAVGGAAAEERHAVVSIALLARLA